MVEALKSRFAVVDQTQRDAVFAQIQCIVQKVGRGVAGRADGGRRSGHE